MASGEKVPQSGPKDNCAKRGWDQGILTLSEKGSFFLGMSFLTLHGEVLPYITIITDFLSKQ